MMYLVEAEWISYDKTNGYNGTIATESDNGKSITDLSISQWVTEANSELEAIESISRFPAWEVPPTLIRATEIKHSTIHREAYYLGNRNFPYWQKAAAALRAIPSKKRSSVSRENGKKGGRPRKQTP